MANMSYCRFRNTGAPSPAAAGRMTPATLEAAAALLHGTRWKLALAEALEVDYRLVRRWASGERPIPGWVEPALRGELAGRVDAIRKFLS